MNKQEKMICLWLMKAYDLPVVNFISEGMLFYQQAIKQNKGKGFIGQFPPFMFEGRLCRNDFSVLFPSGKLIAIECKERKGVIDITHIQEKITKTKEIIEDKIIFLFEGQGFTKKIETIKQFTHKRAEVVYTFEDLLKVA